MNTWWIASKDEVYWLEITDREFVGMDLNAPQRKDDGSQFWSYSLIRKTEPGDAVFHYHKLRRAIVGVSRVTGSVWEGEVIWGARGTSARGAGVIPYRRPGWWLGLESYQELDATVTLDDWRGVDDDPHRVASDLASRFGRPLYFPFELSPSRPPRPVQGYLAKFPAALVRLFGPLRDAAAEVRLAAAADAVPSIHMRATMDATLGTPYREAPTDLALTERDPYSVDPSLVERALLSHRETQNMLATLVRENGALPRSPTPGEPNFDVAWELHGHVWVAEVKSTRPENAEKQLRLGLGQVLRYQHLLSQRYPDREVVAVLATDSEPGDNTWQSLCASLGVMLVWPSTMSTLFV
jgi:hypothetical protein